VAPRTARCVANRRPSSGPIRRLGRRPGPSTPYGLVTSRRLLRADRSSRPAAFRARPARPSSSSVRHDKGPAESSGPARTTPTINTAYRPAAGSVAAPCTVGNNCQNRRDGGSSPPLRQTAAAARCANAVLPREAALDGSAQGPSPKAFGATWKWAKRPGSAATRRTHALGNVRRGRAPSPTKARRSSTMAARTTSTAKTSAQQPPGVEHCPRGRANLSGHGLRADGLMGPAKALGYYTPRKSRRSYLHRARHPRPGALKRRSGIPYVLIGLTRGLLGSLKTTATNDNNRPVPLQEPLRPRAPACWP